MDVNYIDVITDKYQQETVTYAQRNGKDLNAIIITPISAIGGPIGDKKKPHVMCLHPGGSDYTDPGTVNWAKEFASRGYSASSVEYKLTHGDFTAELQRLAIINVLCAGRFLRIKKEKYGIKGRNMFTQGVSAGAITSGQSNITQNNQNDPLPSNTPSTSTTPYFYDGTDPSAPGNLYLVFPDNSKVSNRIGASSSVSGAATDIILKFLDSKDSSPWFDYHGTLDTKVLYSQAVKTIDAMKALGIASTLNGDETSVPGFADLFVGKTHGTVNNHDAVVADLMPRFAKLIQ